MNSRGRHCSVDAVNVRTAWYIPNGGAIWKCTEYGVLVVCRGHLTESFCYLRVITLRLDLKGDIHQPSA